MSCKQVGRLYRKTALHACIALKCDHSVLNHALRQHEQQSRRLTMLRTATLARCHMLGGGAARHMPANHMAAVSVMLAMHVMQPLGARKTAVTA
jgi:hypothetical protein